MIRLVRVVVAVSVPVGEPRAVTARAVARSVAATTQAEVRSLFVDGSDYSETAREAVAGG